MRAGGRNACKVGCLRGRQTEEYGKRRGMGLGGGPGAGETSRARAGDVAGRCGSARVRPLEDRRAGHGGSAGRGLRIGGAGTADQRALGGGRGTPILRDMNFRPKKCLACGIVFVPGSGAAKWCVECREIRKGIEDPHERKRARAKQESRRKQFQPVPVSEMAADVDRLVAERDAAQARLAYVTRRRDAVESVLVVATSEQGWAAYDTLAPHYKRLVQVAEVDAEVAQERLNAGILLRELEFASGRAR